MNATVWNRICMFLAFAGIFVAGFLSLSYLMNVTIPCGVSNGCDEVARSQYSKWFGIHVPYFGLAAYLALAGLAILRSFRTGLIAQKSLTVSLLISGVGTLVSFYLMYVALVVIKAECIWCIASAALMTLSFLAHGFLSQQEAQANGTRADRVLIGILTVFALVGLGFRFMNLQKIASTDELQGKLDRTETIKNIDDLIPTDNPHVMGPKTAPMIIIEFGDLTCPHCKASYHEMQHIVQASNGKVRFVFRHYPLFHMKGHEMSVPAAVISEIASEKGRFWNFADSMFAIDDASILSADDVMHMVNNIGLSEETVRSRLSNDQDPAYDRVHRDADQGGQLGINSTPVLFVGISGHKPEAETPSSIRQALTSKYSMYVKGVPTD